jgi:hypothetical protein
MRNYTSPLGYNKTHTSSLIELSMKSKIEFLLLTSFVKLKCLFPSKHPTVNTYDRMRVWFYTFVN